ncbi:MAG: hypothetical protein DWI48_02440 [Chloroflexi bacterium]|nr:MAG: hypothetical protein DWI48_02440 [Chloroflexota bacterium]
MAGDPTTAQLDARARRFLEANHFASMTTYRPDHASHTAHIVLALVGDKLWSSGTERRMRTIFLRLNPTAELLVFPTRPGGYSTYNTGGFGASFLSLETTVEVLEGPKVAEQTVEFFKVLQPDATPGTLRWNRADRSYEEFAQIMRDEGRVLYEFDVIRGIGHQI